MKTFSEFLKKAVAVFCVLLTLISVTAMGLDTEISFLASAIDDFEAQIEDFPESYKVYLRQLHKKYPNWKFEMLDTGLDWSEVVEEESSKNRSLVPESSSHFLKSKSVGDYDPETDTYIEKDVGWVSADRIAVEYFMDPRNFLTETNIFQFELLSFDKTITVKTVEEVLEGTFMHNKTITYSDAQGNSHSLDKKYSEVIYNAGETNDVNPCYLASKIRNEIVLSGGGASDSVKGTYAGYEGIYNFYNIGAYDGSEPIKNGLIWAGNDTEGTYGRPWTDPEKSIMYGAGWLAEKYIAKGQNTGYLQRFNVSPSSGYPIYTHQYMTNVSGADSQGYTTYQSYSELGLLSIERVFSIPVFNNMPGQSSQTKVLTFDGLDGQTATINYSSGINIRSSASTLGSIVTRAPYGTKVTILDKTRVNSDRYNHFLNNPFWCHIKFNINGKEYLGYASADYLDFDVSKILNIGDSFRLINNHIGSEQPIFRSSEPSVAEVNSQGVVTAKTCGTAVIIATTTKGGFDAIKIQIPHNFGKWTQTKTPTCTEAGEEVRECVNCDYKEINILKANGHKEITLNAVTATCTKTGLISGKKCSVCGKITVAQNTVAKAAHKEVALKAVAPTYKKSGLTAGKKCSVCGKITVAQKTVAKLTLGKVSGLKAKKVEVAKSSSVTLSWNKVDGAEKYEIQQYKNGKWKKIKTTTKTSYTVKKLKSNKSYKFRVRAVVDDIKGKYSSALTVKTVPAKTTLTLKAGKKQLTASWKTVSSISGYEVQYSTSKSMKNPKTVKVKKSSKKTTIKKLKKGKKYYVRVRSYKTVNSKKIYSSWSTVKNLKAK